VGIFPARRENSREATSNSGEGLLRLIGWSETSRQNYMLPVVRGFPQQKISVRLTIPLETFLFTIAQRIVNRSRDARVIIKLWRYGVAELLLLTIIGSLGSVQNGSPRQPRKGQKSAAPVFSEADAARLLAELQQAVEGSNRRAFLKLLDASKMPNYASFQDQVTEFFEKYESFRMRYHITQASAEGSFGIVLADLELEATPAGAPIPVRRSTQLRLLAAWDGKQWKIVDWAPRSVLN
jgi:hypothetical protein